MAKFYGKIGFAISNVEKAPGVYADSVVEKSYIGDVVQAIRQAQPSQDVNDDLTLQNSITVVADAYINENMMAIRYVRWQGGLWKVTSVQATAPRLLLRFGGVYNGPTP